MMWTSSLEFITAAIPGMIVGVTGAAVSYGSMRATIRGVMLIHENAMSSVRREFDNLPCRQGFNCNYKMSGVSQMTMQTKLICYAAIAGTLTLATIIMW